MLKQVLPSKKKALTTVKFCLLLSVIWDYQASVAAL